MKVKNLVVASVLAIPLLLGFQGAATQAAAQSNNVVQKKIPTDPYTIKVGKTKELYSAKGYDYDIAATDPEASACASISKKNGKFYITGEEEGTALMVQLKDGKTVKYYNVSCE